MTLFLTGFLQVFLVSAQTVFLSDGFTFGVAACGFLISFVWTWNVRRVVIGRMLDRVTYSGGAAFGAVAGMFFGRWMST